VGRLGLRSAAVTYLAAKSGFDQTAGLRLASYGTMLLSVGTIIGCIVLPILAERFGRRLTLAIYFALMFVFISLGFGMSFTCKRARCSGHDLFIFPASAARILRCTRSGCRNNIQPSARQRVCIFNFSWPLCRRGITFLVGAGVSRFHTIGTPVALTSLAFIVGLLLLPFGRETREKCCRRSVSANAGLESLHTTGLEADMIIAHWRGPRGL